MTDEIHIVIDLSDDTKAFLAALQQGFWKHLTPSTVLDNAKNLEN